jgi:hypothetical protein
MSGLPRCFLFKDTLDAKTQSQNCVPARIVLTQPRLSGADGLSVRADVASK